MQRPRLIFVSGFLGSGKTTLILKAAEMLEARGMRAAVILNDQDAGLVDTQLAHARNLETREVSGGCFCCRFSDLLDAAHQLRKLSPDVILAEPVGSCIDLSATILQPLLAYEQQHFDVAPLTVLIDAMTASQVCEGKAADEVAYLFRNQIAEADIVCLSKSDLDGASIDPGFAVDFRLSALAGDGMEGWLLHVLESKQVSAPDCWISTIAAMLPLKRLWAG